MSELPLIFDVCRPRPEVLSKELTDNVFAANLDDVVAGKAHRFYQDPNEFFQQTHITESMKHLVKQMLERLRGAGGAAPYCRLETPFGGGKTHTLIALWHIIHSSKAIGEEALKRLGLKKGMLPSEQIVMATIVGNDINPVDGNLKSDGTKVYNLWGELAYHFGGKDGYQLVKGSDSSGMAPSAGFLDKLIGDNPVLILIDELANYLRRMPDDSKKQLPAFFHNLTEWVSRPGTKRALVVTFAEDAFRDEAKEIQESLATVVNEVRAVSARYETTIVPSERMDYPLILRRRLFQDIDQAYVKQIASEYANLYRGAHRDDFRLPENCQRGDYAAVLTEHYPFHPTLIDLMDGKLATIPSFQKTRGALRLLARTIQHVWSAKPPDTQWIQPFHIDIGQADIGDEIIGRLNRGRFRDVANIDVARGDGQSHAQLIDSQLFKDDLPYAQRAANVVFLHSLAEPPAQGLQLPELRLSLLTKQSNPGYINKAVQELDGHMDNACWHLDHQGEGESGRYFFTLEPQLNRIIVDELKSVQQSDVRLEIERRIKSLWKSSAGFEIIYFPADSAAIRDEAVIRLSIIHWDTATFDGKKLPENIKELWEMAPGGGFRVCRNGVIFLIPSGDRVKNMLGNTRRYLAIEHIKRRPDDYNLSKDKKQELDQLHDGQEGITSLAIARAYNILLYPSEGAEAGTRPFVVYPLSVEDQGRLSKNMLETIIDALGGVEKLKRGNDPPLGAAFIIQNAFNKDEKAVTTAALYNRFFERIRLPLVQTPDYIKGLILTGIKSGAWMLYDSSSGRLHGPTTISEPMISISTSQELLTQEEVQQRGLKIYGEEEKKTIPMICPGCGRPAGECRCKEAESRAAVIVQNEPGKAFADMEGQAKEKGVKEIKRLKVAWDGNDAELMNRLIAVRTSLGQIMPLVSTVTLAIKLIQSRETEDGPTFTAAFEGDGRFYTEKLATSFEVAAKHFEMGLVTVSMDITMDKPAEVGGADWKDMADIFKHAGLGSTKFELEHA